MAEMNGARLAAWGTGGMGLQFSEGGADAVWLARSRRPLLLFRRTPAGITREEFGFDSWAAEGPECVARARVSDAAGARWAVTLHAGPNAHGGLTGRLRWTLESGTGNGVFVGHRIEPLADPRDLYVCMPGSVYDGNDYDPRHQGVPRVSRAPMLTVPTNSLALPCTAVHARSSGATVVLATAQLAASDDPGSTSTGFLYEGSEPLIASGMGVTAPLFRTDLYNLRNLNGSFKFHFIPCEEPGATLRPGQSIELTLSWFCGFDASIPAFFRRIADLRGHFRAGHERACVLPMSEAAALVEHNHNRYHWNAEGFYANAAEVDGSRAFQLITGWCSGVQTGYGFLSSPDPTTRKRAVAMIDFICAHGVSPSGLFYSAYEDKQWQGEGPDSPSAPLTVTPWNHIRAAEDATYFLLRAYRHEKARGVDHPAWIAAATKNLDAFVRVWDRHGEFGIYVSRATGEMQHGGSAAGTLCIGCLAEGFRETGNERYREVARDAADSYHKRFTATGHANGGPLDILMAPDSESAVMFPEAYLSVYEATHEERFLRFAAEAADQFVSWALAYDGAFPPGSTLDRHGIQTTGSVIANAQNHHVGPGAASSSLAFFLSLYRYTGEERFLTMLQDCATALPQYVSRFDGHIDRLAKGMTTEQINLTDAMNHPRGEVWNISAGWPACDILLMRQELPGIYVDRARRRVAVLDHLKAVTDWAGGTLTLENPTEFPARTSVEVDGAPRFAVDVAPGMTVAVRFPEIASS